MDACTCLARCLTSVISPTIHQGIPAGDPRASPSLAPIPLYDVTTPTTNQKPKALDQSEASVGAIWAHITTTVDQCSQRHRTGALKLTVMGSENSSQVPLRRNGLVGQHLSTKLSSPALV